jgi:manganese/iron transport system permease protein
MLELITEPLNYEFMRHALTMGVVVGILCPIVGSYSIVQRMALYGDVVAHCVLPGLSLSFWLGMDLTIGAFISGMLGAGLISAIRSQSFIKIDAAMALIFSTFFSLGMIFVSTLKSNVDLDSFLFGDILGVNSTDIYRTISIAIIIIIAVVICYKELLFYTFDRTGAMAMGLPVRWIDLGFTIAITLTIIASMQAVGTILVIALTISPALTAYLFVKELHQMTILGSIFGTFSTVTGIYLSYYLNHLPSGPAIVLVSVSLFIIAFLFNPDRGIITRKLRRY